MLKQIFSQNTLEITFMKKDNDEIVNHIERTVRQKVDQMKREKKKIITKA